MNINEAITLKRVLAKYGDATQRRKCTEELGELIAAIAHMDDPHHPRGEQAKQDLVKEVADVEIMLTQFRYMYPWLDSAVRVRRSMRVERLRTELNRQEEDDAQEKFAENSQETEPGAYIRRSTQGLAELGAPEEDIQEEDSHEAIQGLDPRLSVPYTGEPESTA